MITNSWYVASDDQMQKWGQALSSVLAPGDVLALSGELGAGKTTLARGIISGLGWSGPVKSPTYTIVESYLDLTVPVHHFDLYRLSGLEELEMMGFSDYLKATNLVIIEWPERVAIIEAIANWHVSIALSGSGRQLEVSASQGRLQQLITLLGA